MPYTRTPVQPADPLIRRHVVRHREWTENYRADNTEVLNRFHRFLGERGSSLAAATPEDVIEYLDLRCKTLKSSSAHKEFQHLRTFYRWVVKDGSHPGPNPFLDEDVTAPPVGQPDPSRLTLFSPEDYERLMRSFDKRSLLDSRNAAIASLMYRTGLRSIEVSRCEVERLDLEAEIPTIEVLGKGKNGGKWRRVPLSWETAEWLDRYLRRLGPDRRESGPLFLATANGAVTDGSGMTERAIQDTLKKRAGQLGIDWRGVHSFRRSAATNGKERGLDDSTVIAILGWEDGRMLAHYTKSRAQSIAIAQFAANDPTAPPASRRRRLKAV